MCSHTHDALVLCDSAEVNYVQLAMQGGSGFIGGCSGLETMGLHSSEGGRNQLYS